MQQVHSHAAKPPTNTIISLRHGSRAWLCARLNMNSLHLTLCRWVHHRISSSSSQKRWMLPCCSTAGSQRLYLWAVQAATCAARRVSSGSVAAICVESAGGTTAWRAQAGSTARDGRARASSANGAAPRPLPLPASARRDQVSRRSNGGGATRRRLIRRALISSPAWARPAALKSRRRRGESILG